MELIFYKAKGDWLDWGIRWKTWGPYSHVELRFEDHLCFSSSWRDGGVRWRDLPVDTDNWDRLLINMSPENAELMLRWCAHRKGKYDLWGIMGFLLPSKVQDTNKWYCSEICAAAINSYIYRDSPGYNLPAHISPNKLYDMCVQDPSHFQPPADRHQPFRGLLTRDYLAPARELRQDILALPEYRETVELTRLMFADPISYSIICSLNKFARS